MAVICHCCCLSHTYLVHSSSLLVFLPSFPLPSFLLPPPFAAVQAVTWFGSIGYELPQRYNPADFFVDLMAEQPEENVRDIGRTYRDSYMFAALAKFSPEQLNFRERMMGVSVLSRSTKSQRRLVLDEICVVF